jgi:hypothetical protein
VGDNVEDAFDEFDRSWAERQGCSSSGSSGRELELVVMPGRDDLASEVARRRGVPESVLRKIRKVRGHPCGYQRMWANTSRVRGRASRSCALVPEELSFGVTDQRRRLRSNGCDLLHDIHTFGKA